MNKFLTIFKREYLSRVKTKGFIIGTVLTPILLIGLTLGPGLLFRLSSEKIRHYAVIDMSDIVYDEFVKAMNDTLSTGEPMYVLQRVNATNETLEAEKEKLAKAVDSDKLDGYFVIPADVVQSNKSEYYAKNMNDFERNIMYQNIISRVITNYRLKQSNLDPKIIKNLTRRIDLKTFKIEKGGKEKEDRGFSFVITFVMLFFLYMALIMYGVFVMRSVYEEKTSRVVEMIVSSCRPFQLMAGKVLGVGAVGLTQYAIWTGVAALLTIYAGSIIAMVAPSAASVPIPTIPISVLVYFIIFFVLGYLLFATLYAMVGSMVNSDQDAQQFQFPVMIFIILAFFLAFYIIRNPDTTLAKFASFFPLFSPITMFTRISVQAPPFGEILLSIVILILTIIFFIWLAAKIFRVGILMYGKRPTLPEIINWLKY
ncbi:MAG: ABC transporter permease [Calditrichaeota bacterium]|nr:ABC transporter permease [Calditrichota bacterium]